MGVIDDEVDCFEGTDPSHQRVLAIQHASD
jgi:hypothetical protein